MRLTCPSCDAQYEVPDEVIPDVGRDVQCSNCGHTWFVGADGVAAVVDTVASTVDDTSASQDDGRSEPGDDRGSPPPSPPRPDPQDGGETPVMPARPTSSGPSKARTVRPIVEPDVAQVLREEAEFEARARQAESGVEMQPDLGLSEPPTAAGRRPSASKTNQAEETFDVFEGDETNPDAQTARAVSSVVATSRRDLLPDIDEINSTLRATTDRRSAPQVADASAVDTAQTRRRGFRTGFGLALLIFGSAAAVYAYAPLIAEKLPQMQPYLLQYMEAVNGLRLRLEVSVQGLLERIAALSET